MPEKSNEKDLNSVEVLALYAEDMPAAVVKDDGKRFENEDGSWKCWNCFYTNPKTANSCTSSKCHAVRERPGIKSLPIGIMPGEFLLFFFFFFLLSPCSIAQSPPQMELLVA